MRRLLRKWLLSYSFFRRHVTATFFHPCLGKAQSVASRKLAFAALNCNRISVLLHSAAYMRRF